MDPDARGTQELEQAVRSLDAIHDVALAVLRGAALDDTLDLIARRVCALVGARSLAIVLREGDELVGHASAGDFAELRHARLPLATSTYGRVLDSRRPERVVEAGSRLGIAPRAAEIPEVHAALLVPVYVRDEDLGLLLAFDGPEAERRFGEDDERTLHAFAAQVATAVALARDIGSLRSPAAETERERWARELHIEALEALSGLARLLREALRHDDLRVARSAITEAVGRLEQEMQNLGGVETELQAPATRETEATQARAAREQPAERGCRAWDGGHRGRLVSAEASSTSPPPRP
jgi:GAF domain-containing protein